MLQLQLLHYDGEGSGKKSNEKWEEVNCKVLVSVNPEMQMYAC